MRRSSSFLVIVGIVLWSVVLTLPVYSQTGSVAELSEGAWASHKVNLLQLDGASGDVQSDQNGWIYLGANHLDGGDVTYNVPVGPLHRDDIIEIWIDGYSTSNDLNIGPTVFIGKGKNRFEKITRMSGDAWRPFVFHFADEDLYGDITDPSNRNQYWRIRYPSSKYEVRRIDKAPHELLEGQILPIRISVTGAEDFIIKRIEVVVMRTHPDVEQFEVAIPQHRFTPKPKPPSMPSIPCPPSDIASIPETPPTYIVPEIPCQPGLPPTAPSIPCPPSGIASIPQAPPTYIVPAIPGQPGIAPPFAPMPPTAMAPYGAADPTYSAGYTIQIGAFRVRSSALAIVNQLRTYGFDAYISESFRGPDCLFRVRVGKYASKSLAQQDASQLRSRGFETWITSLS